MTRYSSPSTACLGHSAAHAGDRDGPYIARFAGEHTPVSHLMLRDGRLAYADEQPEDRDAGVLLARTAGTATGRRRAADLDPHRQFECMSSLLCQGCGRPATRRPELGVLWLVPARDDEGRPIRMEDATTDSPPVCGHCVIGLAPHCPVMRAHGEQLAWIRRAPVVAVYADLYVPPPAPRGRGQSAHRASDQLVMLDDRSRLDCAVATRLVRHLSHVTPTDRSAVEHLLTAPTTCCRSPPLGPVPFTP